MTTIRRAQRTPRPRTIDARGTALRAAVKQARLEQRARLIGAGLDLAPRRGKFNNAHCTYRGERYDSIGEAEYAHKLDILLNSGQIKLWQRGTAMVLVDAPKARDRITYKPDFWIVPASGYSYFVDYKGSKATETAAWKIKVKLWKQRYPKDELRVVYPDGSTKIVAAVTS